MLFRSAELIRVTPDYFQRFQIVKDAFWRTIKELLGDGVHINGGTAVPSILNVRIDGVPSEALVLMSDTDDVYISAGAACSSGSPQPSHVLMAMGLSEEEAGNSIRVSFGYNTLEQEAITAARIIAKNAHRIRSMYK